MISVANSSASIGAGSVFLVLLAIYAAVAVVTIVAWVKILSKAGYSGWWVLIGLVPVANVVMFLVFAFSDWPILQIARGQRAPNHPATWTPSG